MNPFDSKAAEWDDNPGRVENAQRIADAIKTAVPLFQTMRVLEFGCGTGLISRELFPDLGNILAIDLSSGMIEQLRTRIADAGLQNITAQCCDIFTDPPAGPFDLIFSGMALHHVPDTDALLSAFIRLLAPGGFIALADLDTEDGKRFTTELPARFITALIALN
jgi:2-polyprenyl-3-methyl-5-hydroxy-6-metoxy-1,4-benzoquinol methylase